MRDTKPLKGLERFRNDEGAEEKSGKDLLTFVSHIISSIFDNLAFGHSRTNIMAEKIYRVNEPPFHISWSLDKLL